MLNYPSSIPEYNKLRFLTTGDIDTEDRALLCICAPQGLIASLVGAMSLLSDVNSWEQFGSLNEIEMVDLINNEVIMQACCDAINEAIQECPDIADTIIDILMNSDVFNDYIRQLIQQMLTQNGGAYGALADVNDLDYVWGGLLYALAEYEDSVGQFEIAATGVANIVEFVSNIPGVEFVQSQALESVKTAIDFGTVAVVAYLNDNDTKNQFLCGIFDQICGRGPEYGILPGDIQFGWNNIDAGASSPVPSVSDVVKLFFSNDKFIQLFAIGSDEPDNNWESLCGCVPVTTITYEFTQESGVDPNTVYGNSWSAIIGTYVSNVGYRSVYSAGLHAAQIRLDRSSFPSQTVTRFEVQFSVTNSAANANNQRSLFLTSPFEEIQTIAGQFDSSDSPTVFNDDFTLDTGQVISPEFRLGDATTIITIERFVVTFEG